MAAAAAVRDDAGDGEKSSSFRWLDAVRYVVAAVVVVLIVAVTANAIKVVLRPDALLLSVHGGSVSARRLPSPSSPSSSSSRAVVGNNDDKLGFSFILRAVNPSGRAHMYYYNVTAYLFDNTTTPAAESRSPSDDCLILFRLHNITLAQMQYQDSFKALNASRNPGIITTSFFDELNKPAARINDVTMRVDGILVTEPISGFNTTPKLTTYYCRQLKVGLNNLDESSQETSCTTS